MTERAGTTAVHNPTRPMSAHNFFNKAISLVLAMLTGLEILSLLIPVTAEPLRSFAAALLVVFVPLALGKARRISLVLFVLIASVIVYLCWTTGRYGFVWEGLSRAMTFGAFLPVLQLLRNVASRSAAVREVKVRFYELDHRQLLGGYAVAAFGVGSFLATGAHAVLAPLLGPDIPFHERRGVALASIRGFSFAAFWSPFISPVAFVIQQMPDLPASRIVLLGLLCGVLGLGAELAVARIGMKSLRKILAGLRPLLPGAMVVGAALAAMTMIANLSTVEALIVVVPALSVLHLGWIGGHGAGETVRGAYNGIAFVSDEVLILGTATVFSVMLAAVPDIGATLVPMLTGVASPLLLAAVAALMLVTGAVGFHPSITATVIITLFTSLPETVHRLALAKTIIMTWCLAAMVSPVGITIMVACQMYRVPYAQLIWSRNLLNVLLMSAGGVAFMTLIRDLLP